MLAAVQAVTVRHPANYSSLGTLFKEFVVSTIIQGVFLGTLLIDILEPLHLVISNTLSSVREIIVSHGHLSI